MRIETGLYGAVVGAIERHYKKAKEKHPYFCDGLTGGDVYGRESRLSQYEYYDAELRLCRDEVRNRSENGTLKAEHILQCEYREVLAAYARGDNAAAVEECYDAIAVLLRVIDVLEGRQTLGKPTEGEVAHGEGDDCAERFWRQIEEEEEGLVRANCEPPRDPYENYIEPTNDELAGRV